MARRRRGEPHVMAYWLMSARIASQAASLMTSGAGKSGKPWARLMAPASLATRVISRITDSVKPCVRRAVRGEGLGTVMGRLSSGQGWHSGRVGRRGGRAPRSDLRRRRNVAVRCRGEKGGGNWVDDLNNAQEGEQHTMIPATGCAIGIGLSARS